MISIERASDKAIHVQLVEQVRFLIATGRFRPGDVLPSTRKLARQLGISFHTVRKAYRELDEDGLLHAVAGRGYEVRHTGLGSRAVRMEKASSVLHDTLQRLIGLGLDIGEIEYVFEEQISLLDTSGPGIKVTFAARSAEVAAMCAAQLTSHLQMVVEPADFDTLHQHRDADFIVASFRDFPQLRDLAPAADIIGVATTLSSGTLDRASRLTQQETLGLLTRSRDAIPVLSASIRSECGFEGQIIAATSDTRREEMLQIVRESDLVLYTRTARRRVKPLLEGVRSDEIDVHINSETLRSVAAQIPTT
jgi:GntR family transcriptional regulator